VRLRDAGYHVLVIGRPGHVEVRGLVGDLPSHDVVPDAAAVRRYPFAKLGVVCQTTTPVRLAAAVRSEIERRNPHAEVRFVDTICLPTKEHQRGLERLLPEVDAVVVVGGANSNNTRELVRLAAERGKPAYHVRGPADVRPEWFAGCRRVGLTAGTSTLDETIRDVREVLEAV
jgi:4-hydroxy-3-methylbut-2-enyl diphosphate reductase